MLCCHHIVRPIPQLPNTFSLPDDRGCFVSLACGFDQLVGVRSGMEQVVAAGHSAHQRAAACHSGQDQPRHVRRQRPAAGPRQAIGSDVVDVVDDERDIDRALQPVAGGIGVLERIPVYIGVPVERLG
jgi:hypothetical protein